MALLFPPFEVSFQGSKVGLEFAFLFTGASWPLNDQQLAGIVNVGQWECEITTIVLVGLLALGVGRFDRQASPASSDLAAGPGGRPGDRARSDTRG